jgi:hypothetical protein
LICIKTHDFFLTYPLHAILLYYMEWDGIAGKSKVDNYLNDKVMFPPTTRDAALGPLDTFWPTGLAPLRLPNSFILGILMAQGLLYNNTMVPGVLLD